jgi:hypothetical protein
MPRIEIADTLDQRLARSTWLQNYARNKYSQSGEDGVLEVMFGLSPCDAPGTPKKFKPLVPRNKWCVEFGAWDGVFLSNACNLIRSHGWHAVMIESDAGRAKEIKTNHPERVVPFVGNVGFETGVDTLDDFLQRTEIPKDPDLVSIDVDGIDWYIWESLTEYRPRVVIIEFNGQVPNNVQFVQDKIQSLSEGCSLAALIELGKRKGYELVLAVGPNAIFVVEEDFANLDIADNTIHAMRADPPHFLWSCYNGRIYHTLPRLGWNGRNLPLPPDRLQVLAELRHSGVSQGRLAPEPKLDLTTAEGILREIFTIREQAKALSPDERAERNKAAWAAAKAYLSQQW